MKDTDGSLKYFLTDHLGSVVAITDDQGNLISQQRYLPFGAVRLIPNSVPFGYSQSLITDFGYTGQRNLDDDIGLMDYKARFYSPVLNRFIQPDTVVPSPSNPQAWNRFSYVYNNPIRYVDPSGNIVESPWDIFSLGVGVVSLGYNLYNGNYADAALDVAGIAVDAAALLIPGVPGGASVAIKAYRAVDVTVEGAEAIVKYGDDIAEVVKTATHYSESAVAVLGRGVDKYNEFAEKIIDKGTYLYSDKFDEFIKKYDYDGWWDYINEPFIQKEIIEKGKSVITTTTKDVIEKLNPDTSFLRREIDQLLNAGYNWTSNRGLAPPTPK